METKMNENARKGKKAFEQKTSYLFKKAEELSVLCDIDIGIIISNPPDENEMISWPSHEAVKERFTRYMNTSEVDRIRRMTTQESFHLDQVEKLKESVEQRKKINAEKEARILVNQLAKGRNMHEVSWTELDNLYSFASQKLEKIEQRIETIVKENQGQSSGVPETRDEEMTMENLDQNEWDNFPTIQEAGSIFP